MNQSDYYRVDYQLESSNGKLLSYGIDIHRDTLVSRCSSAEAAPDWARMDHVRCHNCTLPDEEFCPIAARLAPAIQRFSPMVSHDRVIATVITPERSYVKEVDAQEAIRSLLGLIMATSGCPSMKPFRYMARYHLPFASLEETIGRIVSTCLLAQLFTHPQTDADTPTQLPFTIREVENLYQTMQQLNENMSKRLRDSTKAESAVNAIIILSAYSALIPMVLDKEMRKLHRLFSE